MPTLYLDIFSGISGDMFVGALLDLGVDSRQLERELKKLPVDGYHLHIAKRTKSSIEGTKFDVHLSGEPCADSGHTHSHAEGLSNTPPPKSTASIIQFRSTTKSPVDSSKGVSAPDQSQTQEHPDDHGHDHGHDHTHGHGHSHSHAEDRDFSQIQSLIRSSRLSPWVQEKAIAVFHRIAVAEGKIHGVPPEKVHFHEVGAVDSIVDIVGACIALDLLGRPQVLASPVVEGTGWVRCAHGRFPVPTAATLEILGARGIPVTQCEEPNELVTPTGAALLAEFATSFAPMAGLVASKVGYGLGTRDNKTRPNVVRAVLCDDASSPVPKAAHDWECDTVTVLETNLDDITAELLGHVLEKAFRLGALDVFHTPIQMKKNRPGVMLTILCMASEAETFGEFLLTETTAFGVRRSVAERWKLRREFVEVPTEVGTITIKLGRLNGTVVQAAPELESCRSVAAQAGLPLKRVLEIAAAAAAKSLPA